MICRKCRKEVPDAPFCCQCGAKAEVTRKPKSRGNGTGSVYQLPNGKWRAVKASFYLGADGKKHRRIVSCSTFKTKKDAINALPSLGEHKKTTVASPSFSKIYEMWLPTHDASKDTINCYKAAYKYFKPIYTTPFSEITVDELQECIDACPKGKRTQQNMKTLAGLLWKYAIPRNYATLNMGSYVKSGGEDGEGKDGLPIEAVEAIEKAVGKVPYADYVLCQCYLGFRPTEFLALDAKHYNRKERAFVGGAKTDAGKDRTVTVSPKIQPIIDRLLADKLAGPVFCTEDGKKMGIKKYRELFYAVLDGCGIDNPIAHTPEGDKRKYTPHSCRHTFATLMKRVDADAKDKLALIGHTSEEMLRHYQDVSYEDLRKITDNL